MSCGVTDISERSAAGVCHVQNHIEELDMFQGGSEIRVRARTHCQHFKCFILNVVVKFIFL